MIKVIVPRMQVNIMNRAIQTFGSAGLSPDTPLANFWTWGRSLQLGDGPDEVHIRGVAGGEIARVKAMGGQAARYLTPYGRRSRRPDARRLSGMSNWRNSPAMRYEAHYGDRVVRCFTEPREGVDAILRAAVAAKPDGEALVDGERRVTYAQFDRAVDSVAAGLIARGVVPGDRIALLLGNRAEFAFALFGANARRSGDRAA